MSATILAKIFESKRREVDEAKRTTSLESLRERVQTVDSPRGFRAALCGGEQAPRVIAEVKKASPSKGVIREDFDPVTIARSYENGGAAAVSVLTDAPFFQGRLEYLEEIHATISIPVLRKDFIVDEYQIWEARAAGADAVLLIVAALDDGQLQAFHDVALELGMDALVEVHDDEELERAAAIRPTVVGVNNRDLRTFEVDLNTTRRLLEKRPEGALIVSESGFFQRSEIDEMRSWGADAFLIGESLMRAPDPGGALSELTRRDGALPNDE